jgi:DNA-binding transcriptional MerR regulator
VLNGRDNPQPARHLRPVDLARPYGLTAQAVRNYEQQGALPPAARSGTGYRAYTEVHAAALRAFLALVPAHGYPAAREIMRAVHRDDLPAALRVIDAGHARLQRDRATLTSVEAAIGGLVADIPAEELHPTLAGATLSVGELARRLDISPATLRSWEQAGILRPARAPHTGRRGYGADDVRDAELAHLLRRGGHLLGQIAAVVAQVRQAGGTAELAAMLGDWQARLTARGRAMLTAAGALADYLEVSARPPGTPGRPAAPSTPGR